MVLSASNGADGLLSSSRGKERDPLLAHDVLDKTNQQARVKTPALALTNLEEVITHGETSTSSVHWLRNPLYWRMLLELGVVSISALPYYYDATNNLTDPSPREGNWFPGKRPYYFPGKTLHLGPIYGTTAGGVILNICLNGMCLHMTIGSLIAELTASRKLSDLSKFKYYSWRLGLYASKLLLAFWFGLPFYALALATAYDGIARNFWSTINVSVWIANAALNFLVTEDAFTFAGLLIGEAKLITEEFQSSVPGISKLSLTKRASLSVVLLLTTLASAYFGNPWSLALTLPLLGASLGLQADATQGKRQHQAREAQEIARLLQSLYNGLTVLIEMDHNKASEELKELLRDFLSVFGSSHPPTCELILKIMVLAPRSPLPKQVATNYSDGRTFLPRWQDRLSRLFSSPVQRIYSLVLLGLTLNLSCFGYLGYLGLSIMKAMPEFELLSNEYLNTDIPIPLDYTYQTPEIIGGTIFFLPLFLLTTKFIYIAFDAACQRLRIAPQDSTRQPANGVVPTQQPSKTDMAKIALILSTLLIPLAYFSSAVAAFYVQFFSAQLEDLLSIEPKTFYKDGWGFWSVVASNGLFNGFAALKYLFRYFITKEQTVNQKKLISYRDNLKSSHISASLTKPLFDAILESAGAENREETYKTMQAVTEDSVVSHLLPTKSAS